MKRNYQSHYGKLSKSQNRGQFLLVMMAFATGYLSSSIVSVPQLEYWLNGSIVKFFGRTTLTTALEKKQIAANTHVPKLEFYTVLTQDDKHLVADLPQTAKVEPSKTVEQQTQLLPSKGPELAKTETAEAIKVATDVKSKLTLSKGIYVVQLASFRYSTQAENFKNKLIAKGFHVKISPVRQGTMQWFRVMLGPYESLSDAQHANVMFRMKEHASGMVRQMDA